MLTISKVSGNRNGVTGSCSWAIGPGLLRNSLPDVLRSEVFNCTEKSSGPVRNLETLNNNSLKPRKLLRVLSIFLPSCLWRGLRLLLERRQNLQSSRDNLFLLHYPAVFLNHTEKVVTSSAWTQRRWENATVPAQQALTSFCFKPHFQNWESRRHFWNFLCPIFEGNMYISWSCLDHFKSHWPTPKRVSRCRLSRGAKGWGSFARHVAGDGEGLDGAMAFCSCVQSTTVLYVTGWERGGFMQLCCHSSSSE